MIIKLLSKAIDKTASTLSRHAENALISLVGVDNAFFIVVGVVIALAIFGFIQLISIFVF